jgi:phosphoribosylformylglycinamidine synthase
MVMGDTVQRPGGDAAVVRVHGTAKGLALTIDVTPRYCKADPVEGGKQAVAETYRNLTATGAQPLAITDCMNFASPEKPEIMGQFAGAIEGMSAACEALDYPVVSGNVSFYNETSGQPILPVPAIGGVGLIPDIRHMMTLALKREGDILILIGEERGHLGQSLYLRDHLGRAEGAPPPVDLAAEKLNGGLVRALILEGKINAAHDLSDGGFYVAAAEMALAGKLGADITLGHSGLPAHALLFGEDQGRYLISVAEGGARLVLEAAKKAGVPARLAGTVGGQELTVAGGDPISLADLRIGHENWLPHFMAGELA